MESPTAAMPEAAGKGKKSEPKVSYPSLYIHRHGPDSHKALDAMPDGDFHFHGHGKVISREKGERNGEKHHRVELEVHHITPMEEGGEGEPSDGGEGLQKELTKIAKKKEKPSKKETEVQE